jgi:nitrogen regulatory protein PII
MDNWAGRGPGRGGTMKKIEAYIKSHRLVEVVEELHMIEGLTGVSVHDIKGFGRTRDNGEHVRIVDNTVNWEPHVKIEVFCLDEIAEAVIGAILKGAHTGLRADGKIYVSPVADAVRISTRERGDKAV